MKVTVNIDCTPEEARTFFGLPDVQPMQKAVMEKMQEQMTGSMGTLDPDTFMKIWFPNGMEGWQNMFWKALKQNDQ